MVAVFLFEDREKLVEVEVLDSSATDYDAIVYNMYGIHAFDSAPRLAPLKVVPERHLMRGGRALRR